MSSPIIADGQSARHRSSSEAATRADFLKIRYAQCWEDADVLLKALAIKPGVVCLSIGSAGDNALAMLTCLPERVVVVDLNPSQLACLELRIAAYRALDHGGLLELMGSRPSDRRMELYVRCREFLSNSAREFWDEHSNEVTQGIGNAGKFERYFATFRNRVLPWVHSRSTIDRLLRGGTVQEREEFFRNVWDTWRWRGMFRLFFSRWVMGRMGRDPSFFRYVQGSVADRILVRTRHALTALNPADNPYLQWILTGRHTTALPVALRPENFQLIRDNLHRLEWHCESLESYLDGVDLKSFDSFNLSDIFEYISVENYYQLLDQLLKAGRSGARLAYWNTLVERRRPDAFANRLRSLDDLSRRLHAQDQAFFYCAFHVEEIV